MKRAYIDIPEGQVHYRTDGSGEPLLLLHQTPMSSDEYTKIIPVLAQHHRVMAMDTLGYGESDRPPRFFTVPDFALSVISFLNALGINKVNIAGHHTGATIAAELAAKFPERVSKLILSGLPCFKPEDAPFWMSKYPPIEIKPDGSHLMEVWKMAMERFPETSLELAQAYTLDFLKSGLGAKSDSGHRAVFTYNAANILPLIKSPTLLIMGDKDMAYPFLDTVRSLVPHNKVKIIKGGTASILRLMPGEWTQAAIDFLRGD
jgi:pimeloyl-ACP methyl ester carboxylesterase